MSGGQDLVDSALPAVALDRVSAPTRVQTVVMRSAWSASDSVNGMRASMNPATPRVYAARTGPSASSRVASPDNAVAA